jgi:hypothetical protein
MEMPTIDVLCMLMNSVRQLKVALMPEAQEGFEDHSVRILDGNERELQLPKRSEIIFQKECKVSEDIFKKLSSCGYYYTFLNMCLGD